MTSVDEPLPVYLVKSGDDQLVEAAFLKLVDELVGADDRSLAVEDLSNATTERDDIDIGAVIDACRTSPFLTARRIVVFRDAWRLGAEQADAIVDYLADPSPTSTLVLEGTSKANSRLPDRVTKAVKAVGHVVDVAVGTGKARRSWVEEQVKQAPIKLDKAAIELLESHLGEDTGRLPGLLHTLTGAFGEGTRIGRDDVAPFLGGAGGVAPWDLTDAIDARDTANALGFLHRMMRGGGRHPLEIMATLHRHYQQMLRLDGSGAIDEQAASQVLGIKGYPAKKALTQSRLLGSANILRAIELLADADLALRGAGWPSGNDELVMEILVARLSRLAPARAASARRR